MRGFSDSSRKDAKPNGQTIDQILTKTTRDARGVAVRAPAPKKVVAAKR